MESADLAPVMSKRYEHLLDHIRDLLTIVQNAGPQLLSDPAEGARQYAAAALARGCDLVEAGVSLVEAEKPEGAGLLARAAWESWLVGTFLLFGREEALLRLEAERLRQDRNIATLNGIQADEALTERQSQLESAERLRRQALGLPDADAAPITFAGVGVQTMATDVGPWIEAATGEPTNVLNAYNMFYRSHSNYDSHGGLGVLERYVDSQGVGTLRLRRPTQWLPALDALGVASMYLSLLAKSISKRSNSTQRSSNSRRSDLLTISTAWASAQTLRVPKTVPNRGGSDLCGPISVGVAVPGPFR